VRTRFAGCNGDLLRIMTEKFGVATPFGGPTSSGMLTLHCPPDHIHALATFLRQHGADSVIVAGIDYVFTRDNRLFTKLAAALY
jgi:ATP phosphoribosyltransferase